MTLRFVTSLAAAAVLATSLALESCAPLPPLEEETTAAPQTAPQPQLTRAQRDSIIMVNRSFAYENWKNGDYASARRQFLIVRQTDVEHQYNIYRSWADCFVKSGEMDSALFAYEEGVKYFPDDDYLRNALAIMYRNRGMLAQAIEQQQAAVNLMPDSEDYLLMLAEMYESDEQWEAAIDTYRRLIQLDPKKQVYSERLTGLVRTHQSPEEYLKTLKGEVDKFPQDAQRRLNYAAELLSQGRNEDAVREFREYIALKPDDPEGSRGLAHALQNLGVYRKALAALERVVELDPDAVDEMIEIGKTHLQLGNWTRAREWALRAQRKRPNFGRTWVLLGDVYYRAADKASGASPKFNDKLVYTIAHGLYRKGMKSDDPQARADAERALRSLEAGELVPSREERFMHRHDSRPTGDAYGWINPNWPEVRYIDTYLKGLD